MNPVQWLRRGLPRRSLREAHPQLRLPVSRPPDQFFLRRRQTRSTRPPPCLPAGPPRLLSVALQRPLPPTHRHFLRPLRGLVLQPPRRPLPLRRLRGPHRPRQLPASRGHHRLLRVPRPFLWLKDRIRWARHGPSLLPGHLIRWGRPGQSLPCPWLPSQPLRSVRKQSLSRKPPEAVALDRLGE